MTRFAHARKRAGELSRDPVVWTEIIQIVKTVVAAVAAWLLAKQVFDLPQPFLAPWAALLVVHATVYRTLWTGTKQITATVVGIVMAWWVGNTLGVDALAIAVMLLAALAVGQVRWLRAEATTGAATALIVLTTGYSDNDHVLLARLFDTAIGVAVGVVINAVVWPPLRDHTAARAVAAVGRKVGDLLAQVAEECDDKCSEEHVEEWVRRSQELDEQVDEAWALVRQARESGKLNLRKDSVAVRSPGSYGDILSRTEQALAEIRSLARTLEHSITDSNEWDDEFRHRWTELLRETAQAIQNPDATRLGHIRNELRDLARDMSREDLSSLHWPEYGGLILNLRNIATSMDTVADSDPIGESSRGPLGTPAL